MMSRGFRCRSVVGIVPAFFLLCLFMPLARAQEPIAHWPLDTDTTESVSGIAGTLEGDAGISGSALVGDGALELDGDGDFLETHVEVPLDGEEMSVSFWFRKTGENESGTFFAKSPGSAEDGAKALFQEGEEVLVYDATNVGAAIGEFPFDDGGWHHVAYTRSGDLYGIILDGVTLGVEIEGDLLNVPDAAGHTIQLGFYEFDPGEEFPGYWDGLLDDVRVYDVALSEVDVAAIIEEALDCPEEGDTHCESITVEGPDGNAAGVWTVTVNASDQSGDDIVYTLLAAKDDNEPVERTQVGENVFEIRLSGGSWVFSAIVDDQPLCDDEAADVTCDETEPVDVVPAPEELIGQWCMSEASGLVAEDVVGGNDGELTNMDEISWTVGPRGDGDTALLFDGDDDVLVMENPDAFFFHEDYTWSAWIRTTSDGTILAWSPHDDEWNFGSQALFIREDLLTMDVGWIDFFEQDTAANETSLVDGEWHHVALTAEFNVDGFSEVTTFYIDGTAAGSNTWDIEEQGIPENATFHAGFGSVDFPEDPGFAGVIDDIRVWNFALSEDEVAEVFEESGSDCPAADFDCAANLPDTHCESIEVEGPEGDFSGEWTVTVTATDDSGDEILYLVTATRDGDPPRVVTRRQFGENVFELNLSGGTWEIASRVDDSLLCEDAAEDAECAAVTVEVIPRPPELTLAFCFEDEDEEFTEDTVSEIGADLVADPEDGDPPFKDEGLVSDQALVFDGIDDAMIVDPTDLIDGLSSFTMSCWLQVGEDPNGEHDAFAGNIAMLGPEFGESGDAPGYYSWFIHSGTPRFHILFCCDMEVDPEIGSVADGEPHHVAISVEIDFDGDLDRAVLYVDGQIAGEMEENFHAEGNPDSWPLTIGHSTPDWPSNDFPAENGGDINYFNGIIDDFKYWSFAMEEGQVLDEFDDPPGEGCGDTPEVAILKPGDVNGDGDHDLSDPVAQLGFLFAGETLPECYVDRDPDAEAAMLTEQGLAILDFNGDDKGDLADAVGALSFLFSGGPAHVLGEDCVELPKGTCSDKCE